MTRQASNKALLATRQARLALRLSPDTSSMKNRNMAPTLLSRGSVAGVQPSQEVAAALRTALVVFLLHVKEERITRVGVDLRKIHGGKFEISK